MTSPSCPSTAAPPTAPSSQACAAACRSSSVRPGRVIDHIAKGSLDLSELQSWCWTKPTKCCAWASSTTWSRSCSRPRRTARWRCSRPPCRARSAASSKQYLNNPAEITVDVQDHHRRQHPPALLAGQRPAQARRPDPHPRGRRPSTAMIVFVRTKMATEELAEQAAGPRLRGCRHQRRHPAAAARAHHRRAEGRQASTSWSPPTSPPAASTWSASAT